MPPKENGSAPAGPEETTADKVMDKYKEIGQQEGHKYGVNPSGSKPIDFNVKLNPDAAKIAAGIKAGRDGPAHGGSRRTNGIRRHRSAVTCSGHCGSCYKAAAPPAANPSRPPATNPASNQSPKAPAKAPLQH